MTINIYWTSLEKEWLRCEEPETLFKSISNTIDLKTTRIGMCPAFGDYVKNTFVLKSIYNYELYLENNKLQTSYYDQDFFDEHVIYRNADEKIIHFGQRYVFFTDEKKLKISLEHPFFSNTFFSNNCSFIPGSFDIANWYRNTDIAFFMKTDKFKVEEGDPLFYIRFHTDEKIKFIQYNESEKLEKYRLSGTESTKNCGYRKSLDFYYKIFKNKNNIIKEIKNNIVN